MREVGGLAGSQGVLDYLRAEQPIPLKGMVCQELREAWFLISPALATRSVEVQIAMRSLMYGGRPPMAEWLKRRVVAGIVDAMHAASEVDQRGAVLLDEEAADYVILRELFGVELNLCRRVMLRFNGLDVGRRRMLFEVVARGRSLHDLAQEIEGDVPEFVQMFDETLSGVLSRSTATPDYNSPWMSFADDLMFGEDL